MLYAEEKLIRKLIFESEVSRYRIAKDTGIPSNTLSDIHTGKTSIAKMRFGTAAKLTEYAKEMDKMLAVKDSMDKIIDLKEKIERAKHDFPQIVIYDNKAHVTKVLRESVIEEEEDMDDLQQWIDGLIGRFDDTEPIIEIDLGNGEPQYFAADEWDLIDEYTN